MFVRSLALIAGALVALGAHNASAQDPTDDNGGGPARNFGGAGQIAFSSDASFVIEHSSQSTTTISFAPAADFFVINNFSVGGSIAFDYANVHGADGFRFSIGPRVGYNFAFTNMLSVWPKLGFAYAHSNSGYDVGGDLSRSRANNGIALNIFVPVMMHPATHFFVGFGPFLDSDLSGDNRVTSYGLRLTIGGWMG
jgi:hypothetical protein